ncbi:MAG TPA: hypothetical protein VFQ61_22500 [Polyangiaceae bacterium]|nr:hypothetical protein [Polyangiaceae bacterium]
MQPLRSVGLGLGGAGLGLIGLGLVAVTVRLGWASFIVGHPSASGVVRSAALPPRIPKVLALSSDPRAAHRADIRSGSAQSAPAVDSARNPRRELEPSNPGRLRNVNAFIPPQCYAKTSDSAGRVHNPCYVCHVSARAPNFVDDAQLQLEYAFEARARENPWRNALENYAERSQRVSDAAILNYVRQSNYLDPRGEPLLGRLSREVPAEWDVDHDARWSGFVPDARFVFDERGFDRTPDAGYTGWRSYGFYPLPGAFMPTNGAFGDALVRLPATFRETEEGTFDPQIYELNLALLESLITRRDVQIEPTDEARYGIDLDGNAKLGLANRAVFKGALASGVQFVGRAGAEQRSGSIQIVPGLYPVGTEFLHSLRYLDVGAAGVSMAPRMKELRYARKESFVPPAELARRAREEAEMEREFAALQGAAHHPPEAEDESLEEELGPRAVSGNAEQGVRTDQGFRLQGFIEDRSGQLRPQSFEESVYCVGCHGGVGATDDGIFSFSRRLDYASPQHGWFHPTQHDLKGTRDPQRGGSSEYVRYLELNGAGDEYRANLEVLAKFFTGEGRLRPEMRERLRRDVTELLLPSPERAYALNKAYYLVVQDQSFVFGRELAGGAERHVLRSVAPGEKTRIARIEPAWRRTSPGVRAAPRGP